jgi:tetratricopeptide (TPR) repeat protein
MSKKNILAHLETLLENNDFENAIKISSYYLAFIDSKSFTVSTINIISKYYNNEEIIMEKLENTLRSASEIHFEDTDANLYKILYLIYLEKCFSLKTNLKKTNNFTFIPKHLDKKSLKSIVHAAIKNYSKNTIKLLYETTIDSDIEKILKEGTINYENLLQDDHYLSEVDEEDKKPEKLYHKLGVIYFINNDYELATIAFEKSLIHEKPSFETLKLLGDAYTSTAEFKNALRNYKKALKLCKTEPEKKELKEVIKNLQKII